MIRYFSVAVLVVILALTVWASLDRGVFEALAALWPDPWFRATLADAYAAFLTVWLWVAWRERSRVASAIWLLIFLGLGSMGIALYVLTALAGARGGSPAEVLMRRRELRAC